MAISSAMAIETATDLPAFDKLYPEVFPSREPEGLPPLGEGRIPHLPHNSTIIAPLTELTGNTPWRWDNLQQTAFDQVKRLCDSHVPITPTDYKEVKEGTTRVFLITDASKVGCGAIICHGADLAAARNNIAAMHSRRFTATHENYNTTEQELLAIVDALQAFESKLLGIPFTIVTDHKALEYLATNPIRNGRLARWLERLQMFDYTIQHTPGATNILADTLSRIYELENRQQTPTEEFVPDDDDINSELFTLTSSDSSPLDLPTFPEPTFPEPTFPKSTATLPTAFSIPFTPPTLR
jgi:hypothetical protein